MRLFFSLVEIRSIPLLVCWEQRGTKALRCLERSPFFVECQFSMGQKRFPIFEPLGKDRLQMAEILGRIWNF